MLYHMSIKVNCPLFVHHQNTAARSAECKSLRFPDWDIEVEDDTCSSNIIDSS